jgi:hypothetical protein
MNAGLKLTAGLLSSALIAGLWGATVVAPQISLMQRHENGNSSRTTRDVSAGRAAAPAAAEALQVSTDVPAELHDVLQRLLSSSELGIADPAAALRHLQQSADRASVTLSEVRSSRPTPAPRGDRELRSQSWEISASGDYQGLLRFLDNVERLPVLAMVERLTMLPTPEGAHSLQLNLYWTALSTNHEPSEGGSR